MAAFGGLIYLFQAAPSEFRTAWFLESMAPQILVIYIIRTNGRPWTDLPRPALVATSLGALLVAMALPFTPLARLFGFQSPPLDMTGGIVLLVIAYLLSAEVLKRFAIKKASIRGHGSRSRKARTVRPHP